MKNWKNILLFKSKVSRGDILTSVWSLQVVSFTWFYFAILFIIFEIRDRWTQFSLDDSDDPDNESDRGSIGSVSGSQTKVHKIKRWYTIRLRSNPIDPSYPENSVGKIHFNFYYLREKCGQFILPINSFRKFGQIYTDLEGNNYLVILIHWHTAANLSNVDEMRIAIADNPESPEIYLRDLDVREAELKIRVHCPIKKAFKPFPFVPGSAISFKPTHLDFRTSDDFRSPFERITQTEVITLMFIQSNLSQALLFWYPIISPNSSIRVEAAISFGAFFYAITTFVAIVLACYYQVLKVKLTPLRSTKLSKCRKLLIISSSTISSLFLITVSLLATKYPPLYVNYWAALSVTGHSVQALAFFLLYYWYKDKFSLELTRNTKTTTFLWFRFKTIDSGFSQS